MKEREKEKFIENIMLGQIELAEEFGETFFSEVEILIDFIKKINVVKISKKLSGVMTGKEIIDVIIEVAFVYK